MSPHPQCKQGQSIPPLSLSEEGVSVIFAEAVRAAQHKALWQHFRLQPLFGKASVKFLTEKSGGGGKERHS